MHRFVAWRIRLIGMGCVGFSGLGIRSIGGFWGLGVIGCSGSGLYVLRAQGLHTIHGLSLAPLCQV